MKAILKGIYDEYNGSATLKAALPGGLRTSRVAPGPTYPFGVVDIVGGGPEWPFASQQLERLRAQFSIFGETAAGVADAADKLKAVYDQATLTVSSMTGVGMNRLNEVFFWADGYYTYVVDYEVLVQNVFPPP